MRIISEKHFYGVGHQVTDLWLFLKTPAWGEPRVSQRRLVQHRRGQPLYSYLSPSGKFCHSAIDRNLKSGHEIYTTKREARRALVEYHRTAPFLKRIAELESVVRSYHAAEAAALRDNARLERHNEGLIRAMFEQNELFQQELASAKEAVFYDIFVVPSTPIVNVNVTIEGLTPRN